MARSIAFLVALGWVLAFAGSAAAADKDDDLKAVIDKAIKAHGGEEKLNKFKAGTMKGQGKLEILGMSIDISQESAFMLPDKIRESVNLEIMGQKISVVSVVNGKDIWIKANGQEVPVSDEIKATLKDASHMFKVMKLAPLKGKEFELSSLGEVKVEGKPAIGIKVTCKDAKDVSLYFDKETHLIAKVLWKVRDDTNGQEVEEERIIVEYGKSQDIPVAKKLLINRDGKKYLELEFSEMKLLEKLDDNEFAKP